MDVKSNVYRKIGVVHLNINVNVIRKNLKFILELPAVVVSGLGFSVVFGFGLSVVAGVGFSVVASPCNQIVRKQTKSYATCPKLY